jgi:Cu2+-containing amine oxidase
MVKASSHGHPLDALSAEEIKACSKACSNYAEQHELDALRFNVISLKVIMFRAGSVQDQSLRLGLYVARRAFFT